MISEIKLSQPLSPEDHARGPANAGVELVEYGDYQCPYCRTAHFTVKQLGAALEGRVRFVYRNFPLTEMHPYALSAALAAEAASHQGKFWEMHDLIFETQDDLRSDTLIELAELAGLDRERFMADVSRPEVKNRVLDEVDGGARSGVNGTPTFFMNGQRFEGPFTFDRVLAVLEALEAEGLGNTA